ncbi:MAG: TatD family hydrolase [Nitrososphaerales archaeon]
MRFIDSHLHLCEYGCHLPSLNLARVSGTMLLSSAIDRASSMATLEIARSEHGLVKAFLGVHPSEAEAGDDLGWFEGALHEATGAGELGLDPKYSEVSPKSPQMTAFVRQLEAVEKAGKPVQVHSRGAEKECLEVLSTYDVKPVLLHWFQGEAEQKEANDRGYFVSFGPAFLHSKRLQRMASSVDPALVLTESDGPVTFAPLGGAGGPSLIPTVVFALAELWRQTFQDAEERLLRNGLSYLDVSGKT